MLLRVAPLMLLAVTLSYHGSSANALSTQGTVPCMQFYFKLLLLLCPCSCVRGPTLFISPCLSHGTQYIIFISLGFICRSIVVL